MLPSGGRSPGSGAGRSGGRPAGATPLPSPEERLAKDQLRAAAAVSTSMEEQTHASMFEIEPLSMSTCVPPPPCFYDDELPLTQVPESPQTPMPTAVSTGAAAALPGAASAGGSSSTQPPATQPTVRRPPALPKNNAKTLPRGSGGRFKAPARKAEVDPKMKARKTIVKSTKMPSEKADRSAKDEDAPNGASGSLTVGAVALPSYMGVYKKGADSSSKAIMVQAVQAGNRSLRTDVSKFHDTLSSMAGSLNNLLRKMEAQGQALDKVSSALTDLTTKVGQGPSQPSVASATAHAGAPINVKTEMAVTLAGHKGYQEMLLVRSKLRESTSHTIGNTKFTEDVYPDGDMTSDIISGTVASVLSLSGEAINDWLMQWIPNNARSQKGKAAMVRARDPLQRLKPHSMQDLRRKVLEAVCHKLGVPQSQMTPEVGLPWLVENEYLTSVGGCCALHFGLQVLFNHVGAPHRVKQPTTPGGKTVVACTVGHLALVASFVRHFLEVLCDLRSPGRSGIADGAFEEWRDEIARVVAHWPSGIVVHRGVHLIDLETVKAVVGVVEDGAAGDAEEENE